MGKYQIKISYKTGDSFGSSNEEEFLDYEWDNFEMAKVSLRRIKNHNEYCSNHDHWNKPEEDIEGVVWDGKYKFVGLELLTDDGNPYRTTSFWVGYFEKLHKAEIVYNDSDTVYIPN